MFQPVIPISGYGGWKFLQSTYDKQLQTHADTAQVKADRAYLADKLSKPITTEAFLDDKRLLRVALTAFDLGGEEWKRGFIDKVLKEVGTPDSSFLARLNNPQYTAFAETFRPVDGKITVAPEVLEKLTADYAASTFETAVGEVDESMRLALNYQAEVKGLIGSGTNEQASLFRLLGNVPVRTFLESALNLPKEMTKLSIDRQAEILKTSLDKRFGISDLTELTTEENMDKMLRSFHAMQSINNSGANYSPAANALTLLNGGMGLGGQGGINLLLSGL